MIAVAGAGATKVASGTDARFCVWLIQGQVVTAVPCDVGATGNCGLGSCAIPIAAGTECCGAARQGEYPDQEYGKATAEGAGHEISVVYLDSR
jgi:hypothetical protein